VLAGTRILCLKRRSFGDEETIRNVLAILGFNILSIREAHFSQRLVAVWDTIACLQGQHRDGFSVWYLILPAAVGPGVYLASNRNEYQKHKNNVSGE
jgi:hypothetical protein